MQVKNLILVGTLEKCAFWILTIPTQPMGRSEGFRPQPVNESKSVTANQSVATKPKSTANETKNPSQNLRNVRTITILNDGRKPPIRRFLWELPRFLKTCRIV
ncbi:hypothetical protein LBHA_15935 [Leptospira borgpetersenii serovar Hardjo]|nr:hypothetical protein LBK9_15970 [Leptospira borgpetersenii serovar Hardjo]AMX66244.1 hypothetical protein LBK30_15970 [Leptospira borgpetersenii serovar Hardjo]AMX69476.1 hypothetical protein LBHA_15935 [Leptospira borgpetersenii serovar Hardjo]AMX69809.1 hypothetical protein LBHB_00205 [Leptospira borgpetersenii serovar Hardjo]